MLTIFSFANNCCIVGYVSNISIQCIEKPESRFIISSWPHWHRWRIHKSHIPKFEFSWSEACIDYTSGNFSHCLNDYIYEWVRGTSRENFADGDVGVVRYRVVTSGAELVLNGREQLKTWNKKNAKKGPWKMPRIFKPIHLELSSKVWIPNSTSDTFLRKPLCSNKVPLQISKKLHISRCWT